MRGRSKSYSWIKRRQFCWAHPDRDFQAMVDRGGESAEVGRQLSAYSREGVDWWDRGRDGAMARGTLRKNVSIPRTLFRSVLSEGVECGCAKAAGTCRE